MCESLCVCVHLCASLCVCVCIYVRVFVCVCESYIYTQTKRRVKICGNGESKSVTFVCEFCVCV